MAKSKTLASPRMKMAEGEEVKQGPISFREIKISGKIKV
jgi:hypothetical protein